MSCRADLVDREGFVEVVHSAVAADGVVAKADASFAGLGRQIQERFSVCVICGWRTPGGAWATLRRDAEAKGSGWRWDCQEVPQTEKMEKAKENLISEPKEKVEKLKSAKVWVM